MASWVQIWRSMRMRWSLNWRLSSWTQFAWFTTKFWRRHTSMIRDLLQYIVIPTWVVWLRRQSSPQALQLKIHSKSRSQVSPWEIQSATSSKKSKEIKTSMIKWFSSGKYLMTISTSEPSGRRRRAQILTPLLWTRIKRARTLTNSKPRSQPPRAKHSSRTFSTGELTH